MKAPKQKVTSDMAAAIVDNPDMYVQFMLDATHKYAASVRTDIALMRRFQADYPHYYAVWCINAGIISNGMDLEQSFYAAHAVTAAMLDNPDMAADYDIVNAIIKAVVPKAGSLAYGQSVKAIAAQWSTIAAWTPAMMQYRPVRTLSGMGPKTCMWTLALWNHHAHVFTLDRWMLRGLAGLEQRGSVEIAETDQNALAEMLLEIAAMLEVEPLVAQWSMWNVYRHDTHADHSMAVPEWYRDALPYYDMAA